MAPLASAARTGYRMYVPDNVADKVAKSWRAGNPGASIADYRTEKDVRPTHLTGDAVHYLYPVADADSEFANHKETLVSAARSVTHLGWGVDMVAGNAQVLSEEEVAKLAGECWRPVEGASGTPLRVPRAGTLQKLMEKHEAFLGRLSADGFKPVLPLTAFDTVAYRRDTEPAGRAFAAFKITAADPDDPNPAFDAPRRAAHVAAWVRHATGQVSAGWPFEPETPVAAFVHGHGPDGGALRGARADDRFMYLPLPSIEHRGERGGHVGAIRRVLVAAPPAFRDRVEWLRRRLAGRELVTEDQQVCGVLADLPTDSDWVSKQYVGSSAVWSTVTPLVWPGHDDHDPKKAERILRKAFVDAGLSQAVVDGAELAWRNVGFRPGVDLASWYELPATLAGRRSHVRVRFRHAISGPLAVGAGRYRGLGVFAAEGS